MDISNATVVIPAHNRPEHLRRLLDYYSTTNIHILVADSSVDECPFTKDYPHIIYRHQPNAPFLRKIYEALPLIQTPYVFYCADDDFTVPQAVEQIIAFLDAHPDYSTAQGHYLTFERLRKKVEFIPRYIRHFEKRIDAETGTDRLMQYKDIYASSLYGIVRTGLFKEMYAACMTNTGELRFRNLFLAEVYFNLYTLIHGKYITIPVFYSARERIQGSATSTTVPFDVVMKSPEYRSEYTGFIDALTEKLAHQDGISVHKAKEIIHQVIAMPKVSASLSFKRSMMKCAGKHCLTRWIVLLMEKRFKQKGLAAVRGIPSYPCTFMTPEKQAILNCISNHHSHVI